MQLYFVVKLIYLQSKCRNKIIRLFPLPPGIFVSRYVPGSKDLIKKNLVRFSYGSYNTLCTIRYVYDTNVARFSYTFYV